MRVAVIVVTMLMVTTPSEASRSCMGKTEARQHFGAVHIYWHGRNHCWDATATRQRQQVQNVAQRKNHQPKWHDSMSKMLLDVEDMEPVQTTIQVPWIDRWVDVEPSQVNLVTRPVDIAQVAPPPVTGREPWSGGVVFAFIAIVLLLTLATIEFMFRCTIYERPQSTTNF